MNLLWFFCFPVRVTFFTKYLEAAGARFWTLTLLDLASFFFVHISLQSHRDDYVFEPCVSVVIAFLFFGIMSPRELNIFWKRRFEIRFFRFYLNAARRQCLLAIEFPSLGLRNAREEKTRKFFFFAFVWKFCFYSSFMDESRWNGSVRSPGRIGISILARLPVERVRGYPQLVFFMTKRHSRDLARVVRVCRLKNKKNWSSLDISHLVCLFHKILFPKRWISLASIANISLSFRSRLSRNFYSSPDRPMMYKMW